MPPRYGNRKLPPGPTDLPRVFVVRSQRERMLVAMARSVLQRGYTETTVAHVIAEAMISRRTYYEHFANKLDCFLGTYDATLEQLVAVVGEAYARPGDFRTRGRAGLDAFLRFWAAEPELARLCIVEVFAAGDVGVQRHQTSMEVFRLFFEQGRRWAPPDMPAEATELLVGGIYAVAYARVVAGNTESLPSLRPQLMYWAVVPFLGEREAARELAEFAGPV